MDKENIILAATILYDIDKTFYTKYIAYLSHKRAASVQV